MLAYPFFLPDTTHPITIVYTAVQMGAISICLLNGEIRRVLNLCDAVFVLAFHRCAVCHSDRGGEHSMFRLRIITVLRIQEFHCL